ncbi:hypothetical protein ASE66_09215 [Bosea sp. Root483D1]|nr:hypothetical protein ASE66_09215 [Bosea sp. Root483D1]
MNYHSRQASGDPVLKATSEAAAMWLNALPLRWARNAAIAMFIFCAAAISHAGQPSGGAHVLFTGASSILAAIAAYLIGQWAVWSLRTRYEGDSSSMAGAILSTWISGALLLIGVPVILFDAAVQLGMPEQPIGIWRWLISLPVCVAIATLVGMISRIGLNRTIKTAARASSF